MTKSRRKLLSLSLLASSIFSVALSACGNPTTTDNPNPNGSSSTPKTPGSQTTTSSISFIPTADQNNTKLLSAKNSADDSYDGDVKTTTTRAGLNVTKAAVIAALKTNLGLNVDGSVKTVNKLADLNAMLPAGKKLSSTDLTNIVKVDVTPTEGNASELVPSSLKDSIVTTSLTFKLTAKNNTKFLASNASTLVLSGALKVKLTDYHRVNQAAFKVAAGQELTLDTTAPNPATNAFIIEALNNYFSIKDPKYADNNSPIYNVNAQNQPLWTDATTNKPVKHSLSNGQIAQLTKLWTKSESYKGTDLKGGFNADSVKRAVQNVKFVLASNKADDVVVPTADATYTIKANLWIKLIRHWSWTVSDYHRTDSFALNNITFNIQFKTNASDENKNPVDSVPPVKNDETSNNQNNANDSGSANSNQPNEPNSEPQVSTPDQPNPVNDQANYVWKFKTDVNDLNIDTSKSATKTSNPQTAGATSYAIINFANWDEQDYRNLWSYLMNNPTSELANQWIAKIASLTFGYITNLNQYYSIYYGWSADNGNSWSTKITDQKNNSDFTNTIGALQNPMAIGGLDPNTPDTYNGVVANQFMQNTGKMQKSGQALRNALLYSLGYKQNREASGFSVIPYKDNPARVVAPK